MLKKLMYVTGGAILASVLLFGLDVGDYLRTAWQRCRNAVRDQVPVEFELERARGMISELGPQIKNHLASIAREEIELEEFVSQAKGLRNAIERQRKEIVRLREDAMSGKTEFLYTGRRYTLDEVKADLVGRFQRFKNDAGTLANLEKLAEARHRSLKAAQDKVELMRKAKSQLDLEVANLEARHKLLEAAQAGSSLTIDQSHLSRTKDAIAQIRSRIAAAERLLSWENQIADEIHVNADAEQGILVQLARYFGLHNETNTQSANDVPVGRHTD